MTISVKILAAVAIFLIIVAIAAVSLGNNGKNATQTNVTQTSTNSSKILFSSTQYFSYSYVIYPGPVSQQAQSALAGFNLTSTKLQNGTADVKISLIGTNQNQSLVLQPNYKLYIIETTFGDDGFRFDSALSDDGFVVVDPNGYIAQ